MIDAATLEPDAVPHEPDALPSEIVTFPAAYLCEIRADWKFMKVGVVGQRWFILSTLQLAISLHLFFIAREPLL